MWVYQEAVQVPVPAEATVPALPVADETSIVSTEAEPPKETFAIPVVQDVPSAPKRQKKGFHASRDCILLAAAYLFGTFLSGVLSALCSAGETETLGAYLGYWRELFSVGSTAEIAGLFRTEFLTASGALLVLLLLGLSALGALPIFCFMMIYGAGTGLLSFQLLADLKLRALLAYAMASGIPNALAAGCFCMFGAAALQISEKIRAASFGKTGVSAGAETLVGQFVRALFLLLPLCGAATGMLYLCSQLKFFE